MDQLNKCNVCLGTAMAVGQFDNIVIGENKIFLNGSFGICVKKIMKNQMIYVKIIMWRKLTLSN